MDITDEDEGPVGDYGVDRDYGAWHQFGPAEGIWKGYFQCLSDRGR